MPDSKRPKHRGPRRNISSTRKGTHGSGSNSGEETKLRGTHEAKRPQRSSTPTRPEHGAGPARTSATYFYGTHAVSAAWRNPHRPCRALFGTEQALDRLFDSTDSGHAARPTPRLCTSEELSEMVGTGAVHQGLVLSVGALPSLGLEDVLPPVGSASPDNPSHGKRRPPLLLALDQVTDPQNIGAIMRSASAFDVRAVLVQDRNSPHETGAMAKAASGALETVPMIRVTNISRALKTAQEYGYWSVGLSADAGISLAQSIDSLGVETPRLIVMGSEGDGLRRLVAETCDQLAHLPMPGRMESLNVSVATAIALYEATRR